MEKTGLYALLIHRVSMGVFGVCSGRNALFHAFHTPYYYY